MNKILSAEEAVQKSATLHEQKNRIVLAGGCFDILHLGHVSFLDAAKAQGDTLIVLLEADETIRKNKGENRPLNTQNDRVQMLAALEMVDYILPLKPYMTNEDYDTLVFKIKPAIIATTAGDAHRMHKERQAEKVGGKVIDVVPALENHSTTKLFKILNEL